MRILVTGAAGFIGSAVVAELRDAGHSVTAVDAFIPQAHGARPASADGVEHVDLRVSADVRAALEGTDLVVHQAAMVGAGVTAADLPLYASHNDLGTATLLAAMADAAVSRLVLASSMVVYGDGRYACDRHGDQPPPPRSIESLERGRFDVSCPECGSAMTWRLVDEDAPLRPRSSYAASKVAQEHYASAWARQAGGSVVALRYHNVYGPGMPADTPYSGVAAIFRSALERGEPPHVFEDGRQMRDFVHLDDVVTANRLACAAALALPADAFTAYNVCSGHPVSIGDVARLLGEAVAGPPRDPVVTGEFRRGDVRHIVASPEKAARELGLRARVTPAEGLRRFARDRLRPSGAVTTR